MTTSKPSSTGMPTAHRQEDVAAEATREGLMNGALVMIPTAALVALGMRNPNFVRRTNWQSRTALVIMPPLFAFGLTSEHRLNSKMREIAAENRHTNETVRWAEEQMKLKQIDSGRLADLHLSELYLQSVESSGVNIVPGDELGFHHRVANYVQANPIKSLAVLAIPTVATIFRGRSGKEHLDFSVKILHTRVFGQFATLALLLGVMGFKEFMDSRGMYMSQADVDRRVEEMKIVRQALLRRLEDEKRERAAEHDLIVEAHQQDVKDHNVHSKKQQKQKAAEQGAVSTVVEA
ncbi:hypothetical protein MPSEU_001017300 [Mayamaea pseudoterrestris]|nr:hypothetical protein MPSEU_001017300 [Mayamaea pseudoterrestris]